jgi:hypothetical protein
VCGKPHFSIGEIMIEWIKRNIINQYQKGDVIYAIRNNYRHYGIYAGKNTVIHYATDIDGIGLDVLGLFTKVYQTSFSRFSKGDIVRVEKLSKKTHHIYSPNKTLERAKSQIGKGGYNMIFNNCEHFAMWCKTGRHESSQVLDVCENIGMDMEPRHIAQELQANILDAIVPPVVDCFNSIADKLEYVYASLEGLRRQIK